MTLDGQLVNPGGSLTGGSMRKQENTFFGRKKEINDLLKEEKETEKLLADLKKEKSIHDDFCAELSEKVTGRLSVFKNRFGGNIREERRFVPYSFNGEKCRREKSG